LDLFKYALPSHSGHRAGTNFINTHNTNTVKGIGIRTAKGSCPERRKNEDPPIRMKVGISSDISPPPLVEDPERFYRSGEK